jgi:outer membrane protein assembly factor BamB
MFLVTALFSTVYIASAETATTDTWTQYMNDTQRTGYTSEAGPKTGNLLWKSPNLNGICATGPIVADGKVFEGTYSTESAPGGLYCLDAFTGDILWKVDINSTAYTPTYVNGKIYASGGAPYYAGGTGDSFICFDAITGTSIWSLNTGYSYGRPAYYDGRIYLTGFDANANQSVIYAADLNTGNVLSTYKSDIGFRVDTISIDNGRMYGLGSTVSGSTPWYLTISPPSRTYCWDLQTGQIVWSSDKGSPGMYTMNIAVDEKQLYEGALAASPYGYWALNKDNGDVNWYFNVSKTTAGVAIDNNNMYGGSFDGYFYCIRKATGVSVWKYYVGTTISQLPVVADGVVYFTASDYRVYALNGTNGNLIWQAGPYTAGIPCGPAVANGFLYTASDDGYVYCFGTLGDSQVSVDAPLRATYGSTVQISGKLALTDGTSLGNAAVNIQFQAIPLQTWNTIASVTTASDGSYSYTWTPPYEGQFMLRATYSSDKYASSNDETYMVVVSPQVTPQTTVSPQATPQATDLTYVETLLTVVIVLVVINVAITAVIIARSKNAHT